MTNDRLKFRAYDPVEKYYYYDFLIMSDGNGAMYTPLREGEDEDRLIIEQCTGLKDKNGKLVYEGDIVSTILSNGSKFIHMIRWHNGKFVADYGCRHHEEFEDYCSICQEWIEKKEVIGNIHENPELLK